MRVIASTPSAGREPCAARPVVSSSAHTNPLCATHTRSAVGSVTIAASALQRLSTDRVPMLAYSSSATAATITSPARSSEASRFAAIMHAATPAFMSYPPRAYRRPSRTTGSKGRSMPSTPTVSRWPFSISVRPPPLPRATPTTLGRPGAASSISTSSPASRIHAATYDATSPSPAPPGTRSGFTESIATSADTSSATPCAAIG